ncbi:Uncharacterized protein SCF082_LOCUS19090 [Durusdinium trenchii]|uniref:Uncharacterized protein n=1 Tax=Durusdinium trenchii TaxID=1381693 RepID=A0ABP0KTB4_9DINO
MTRSLAAATLLTLLTPATAYIRSATAVSGDVVKGAGDLTKGGKVGLYTVLLQTLNPYLGDLKQLMECCGSAAPLAAQVAAQVNTNQFTGDIEKKIRKEFIGDGKCSDPGLGALMKEGDPTCSYFYSFADKNWKDYSYSAMCVPSDVCSVDVAGATKGLKVGYSLVLQILNRHFGDLEYAGEGALGPCYEGMNMVNLANMTFKQQKNTFVELIKGIKIPLGKTTEYNFDGMTKLGLLEMMNKCEPTPETGVLYVFKNRFWSEKMQTLNITNFDTMLAKQKAKEQDAQAKTEKKQKPKLGGGGKAGNHHKAGKSKKQTTKQAKSSNGKKDRATARVHSTLQEKMSEVTAVAEVAAAESAEVPKSQQLEVAQKAIKTAQANIANQTEAASNLQGMNSAEAGTLLSKAADPSVLQGVVDQTLADFNTAGNKPTVQKQSSGLEVPVSPKLAKAQKKLEEAEQKYFAKPAEGTASSSTVLAPPKLTADSPQLKAVKAKMEAAQAKLDQHAAPELPTIPVVTQAPEPPPQLHKDNPKLQAAIAKLKTAEDKLAQAQAAQATTPLDSDVPATPQARPSPISPAAYDAKVKEAQKKLAATETRLNNQPSVDPLPPPPAPPVAPPSADTKLNAAKEKLKKAQSKYSAPAVDISAPPTPDAPVAPPTGEAKLEAAKAKLAKSQSKFQIPRMTEEAIAEEEMRTAEMMAEERIQARRLDIII